MLGTRNLHKLASSLLLVIAGYYAGATVGISLGFPPAGIAAIWPSTAILLAALLLAPPRYWWMYLLGVVPAHVHVVTNFQLPAVPFVVTLIQVGSNILLAVLAALAVRFVTSAPPKLDSLRNMGAFILLAGVLATAVACMVAVWLFLLTGWTTDFWLAWRQRMLGNVFPIVTIPPVIVLAFAGELFGARHAIWRSYLEFVLITMGVLVVSVPIFGLESPGLTSVPALLLAPLPFLMWAAVRLGVGGTSLTILIVAGVALANAYFGRGPFINQSLDVNVLSLQIFLTAICIPVLLLAALVDERRRAEASLKQTSEEGKLVLAERTMQLALAGKAALVGNFAYDLDTEWMQITEGYAAIHGFPEGTTEIARSEWLLGLHPEDRVRLEEIRGRCFREGRNEYDADYRIVRQEGVRWIDARCFVSYHDDGRPKRVVGVNIDVTGRKRAEDHYRALNAELDHRVKNALATVSAVVSHTRQGSKSVADFVAALDGRIRSMARTHELLSSRRWQGVSLTELVRRELAPYVTPANTEIGGPEMTLSAEAGQVVSMVLHELATNAAKHGALSVPGGKVSVSVLNESADARIAIEWQESGGLAVQAPDACGYGMEVIRDVIPYELGGRVDLSFPTDGLCCRLEIPAEWLSNGTRSGGTVNGAGRPLHGAP